MFLDMKVTPEEEEEMIRNVAEKIQQHGLNVVAVLMLETFKPMVYIGGQMGRFFLSPFLIILGQDITKRGEKFFMIFEKRENIEKVIVLLEEKKRKESKTPEKREKTNKTEEKPTWKDWRRFLPF